MNYFFKTVDKLFNLKPCKICKKYGKTSFCACILCEDCTFKAVANFLDSEFFDPDSKKMKCPGCPKQYALEKIIEDNKDKIILQSILHEKSKICKICDKKF
jgi:hypothetical protein